MQFDVRDFYSQIDHGWLEEALPLPLGLVRSHVHTGGMTIVPLRKNVRARLGGAFEQLSRRGIPQGSALSPLVGEFVVAEVLRGLSDRFGAPLLHAVHHDFHTYSDNIVQPTKPQNLVEALPKQTHEVPTPTQNQKICQRQPKATKKRSAAPRCDTKVLSRTPWEPFSDK